MATLNRTVYYAHRPDFFAEIEEARSHTPPEFIIARQAQSQRDHSSLFSRRIARLTHPHHVRLPDHDENEVIQEAYPQPPDSNMSRATPTSNRPTHIPLPTTPFVATNGSPSQTPASPTSPRSSFLPSFMRSRSRAATLSGRPGGSPTSEVPPASGLSSTRPGNTSVTRSVSTPTNDAGLAATAAGPATAVEPPPESSTPVQTYRIRLVPHLESSRSLAFDPVVRELMPIRVPAGTSVSAAAASVTSVGRTVNGRPPALLLKIGRFTDKSAVPPTSAQANGSGTGATGSGFGGNTLTIAGGGGDVCSGKVAFKSKVVSRSHAEIWCEAGGKFYIRDSASSSGTFLNHIRLSSPNQGSRPTQITDGDILQLGVDYQGGQEDMYRCVKMRVELGRDWQRAASEFNNNALKQLKALGGDVKPADGSAKKGRASVTDCCICLFSVTVCQSLFIAPCSHVFHYKCIRPLLVTHHPGFSCPLCRTFANLDEDVETEDAWEVASRRASVISRRPSSHSIRLPPTTDAPPPLPGSEVAPGQPSTGVGFGGGAASVAQLLSQTSNGVSDSENSDVPMLGPTVDAAAPLARQTTITDGQDHSEGHTAALHGDPALSASLAVVNDPSSLDRMEGVQIPTGFFDHSTSASASEAQTPMNDTFLATLAPSMHQRLELARQIDQVGERVAPVDEEAEAETEAEHEGRGEPAARDAREATEGMDLDVTEVDRSVDAMYT